MRYNRDMNDYVERLLQETAPQSARYHDLEAQLELPEVAGDGRLYRHLADKARCLRGWAEAHDRLQEAVEAWERNREEGAKADKDLAPLYQEEGVGLSARVEELADDLAAMLSFRSDGGDLPCTMTIRPDGSNMDFAREIGRTYQRYLAEQGVDCTLSEVDKLVRLDVGPTGYGLLRREAGLNKRVQGGAATVAVMPEVSRERIVIDPEDVRVDIYRSSGKGGQNINKVETAVRVTHLPTGTVVTCQDERSQLANKKRAMEHLQQRLQSDIDRLSHDRYVGERDSQVRDRSNAIRVWDEQKGWLRDTRTDVKVSLREASRGQIHRLIVAAATQDKR